MQPAEDGDSNLAQGHGDLSHREQEYPVGLGVQSEGARTPPPADERIIRVSGKEVDQIEPGEVASENQH